MNEENRKIIVIAMICNTVIVVSALATIVAFTRIKEMKKCLERDKNPSECALVGKF